MKIVWEKFGKLHDRVYTAKGLKGIYRIDLDKSIDRWIIYVNDMKRVEEYPGRQRVPAGGASG